MHTGKRIIGSAYKCITRYLLFLMLKIVRLSRIFLLLANMMFFFLFFQVLFT